MKELSAKLISIFDKIIVEHQIINYTLKVSQGSSVGDGFIGNISRVTAIGTNKINNENISLSFIYKYPPENVIEREKFKSMDCFEREIYFYNKVIPEFERIQQKFGVFDSVNAFCSYPKCYYAEFNPNDNFVALILEDLTCSGYNMHATSNKFIKDVSQASLLVKELGKFHALSFALRKYDPDVFEKFKSLDNILSRALSTDQLKPVAIRNSKLALDVTDFHDEDKMKLIKEVSPYIWNKIREITEPEWSEPYNVIGHGDCYINNMMFLRDVRL